MAHLFLPEVDNYRLLVDPKGQTELLSVSVDSLILDTTSGDITWDYGPTGTIDHFAHLDDEEFWLLFNGTRLAVVVVEAAELVVVVIVEVVEVIEVVVVGVLVVVVVVFESLSLLSAHVHI
ncbi:hypothetical protein DPMN_041599 [Dreissena polymorpha]|uniref:Uncharacterized protein n=1 Tax=Dreissena polymorpha TaxID=45954 RepID=A0A9D4CXI6_DREPO|nr:hypothetical protein DPMN_041599 [Dreissena polymorpha]